MRFESRGLRYGILGDFGVYKPRDRSAQLTVLTYMVENIRKHLPSLLFFLLTSAYNVSASTLDAASPSETAKKEKGHDAAFIAQGKQASSYFGAAGSLIDEDVSLF